MELPKNHPFLEELHFHRLRPNDILIQALAFPEIIKHVVFKMKKMEVNF